MVLFEQIFTHNVLLYIKTVLFLNFPTLRAQHLQTFFQNLVKHILLSEKQTYLWQPNKKINEKNEYLIERYLIYLRGKKSVAEKLRKFGQKFNLQNILAGEKKFNRRNFHHFVNFSIQELSAVYRTLTNKTQITTVCNCSYQIIKHLL